MWCTKGRTFGCDAQRRGFPDPRWNGGRPTGRLFRSERGRVSEFFPTPEWIYSETPSNETFNVNSILNKKKNFSLIRLIKINENCPLSLVSWIKIRQWQFMRVEGKSSPHLCLTNQVFLLKVLSHYACKNGFVYGNKIKFLTTSVLSFCFFLTRELICQRTVLKMTAHQQKDLGISSKKTNIKTLPKFMTEKYEGIILILQLSAICDLCHWCVSTVPLKIFIA